MLIPAVSPGAVSGAAAGAEAGEEAPPALVVTKREPVSW